MQMYQIIVPGIFSRIEMEIVNIVGILRVEFNL